MIIKLKIDRGQISDFRQAMYLMFNNTIFNIDYLEYFNTMQIIHKINAIFWKSNLNQVKKFTLSLDPNQGEQFLSLVRANNSMLNASPYYKSMFITFCNDIHAQIEGFKHIKQTKEQIGNVPPLKTIQG